MKTCNPQYTLLIENFQLRHRISYTNILLLIAKNFYRFGSSTSKRQMLKLGYAQDTIEKQLTKLRKDGFIVYRSSNKQWALNPQFLQEQSNSKFSYDIKQAQQYKYQKPGITKEYFFQVTEEHKQKPKWLVNR
mgnify:CR=1 FL=1